ncbi:hypothetical protein HPB52_011426 [Rhipicephalus sanguineus]|uniref:Endonuclease/exonuclease/phosphatase domain-containing protein n=1 Tax=Rhipicephalus sanguineus TaxID=34632 RepID=A0A9D4QDD4_RHISA|nr:hypothetical protein HPB52_011426 [Rhipicephalus sanguineus]
MRRCSVLMYVRRELPHTHIDVANVTAGALECCAVTVPLRGVDMTVASVYVRPAQRHFLLCGDMNAHHTTWGSRKCSQRGKDLVDVINQLNLQVLNTGSFTFIRRAGRVSCTAIDVSLATRGASYEWTTEPDSWGSDHLPITTTPAGGKTPRTRLCTIVDWRAFRQQISDAGKDLRL